MKRQVIILCLTFFASLAFGQSLFFDNLNNSTWGTTSSASEFMIREAKQIYFGRLNYPKDSIKTDLTIWSFKDSVLTILFYDHTYKKESEVSVYKYKVEGSKLKITLSNSDVLSYGVGITSTGNNTLLIRDKEKKLKKRKDIKRS